MATEEEMLARFRRMTALVDDDAVYTDAVIVGMIEDLGFEAAIAAVWTEKAAGAASLVDITESGSSRSMSKLREAYLGMAQAVNPTEEESSSGWSGTVEIERV